MSADSRSIGLLLLLLLGCTPTGEGEHQRSDAVADLPGRLPMFVAGRHRLALGSRHTCAIRDGAIYCWGANSKGQLGDRSDLDRPRPVPVIGIDDAISIVADDEHTCALRADGSVWCWGNDEHGQVSGEAGGAHSQPVKKWGIEGARAIATGATISCAVDEHEQVVCWGKLSWGGPRLEIETLTGIDVGVGEHSVCALTSDGHVDCRGPNYYGELGVLDRELLASRVEGLADADALSFGDVHGCVHRSGDAIACWGSGVAHQTGTAFPSKIAYSQTNTNVEINAPSLAKLPAIAQVSAGFHHTCVLARDGRVGCFGSNGDGQSRPGKGRTEKLADVDWLPKPSDVVEVVAGA